MVGYHGFPCAGQVGTDSKVISDFSNIPYVASIGNLQFALMERAEDLCKREIWREGPNFPQEPKITSL